MPYPSGTTMICRDCKRKLSIEKFSHNGKTGGYRRPECRECQHQNSTKNNPNYQNTPGAIAARSKRTLLDQGRIQRIKEEKIRSQNGQCVYCIADLHSLSSELDHKIPVAKGGSDSSENLQALCERCNKEKHAKTHGEYLTWLRSTKTHLQPDRRSKQSK